MESYDRVMSILDSRVNEITNRVCGMKQRIDRMVNKMGELKDMCGRTTLQMVITLHYPSSENVDALWQGRSYTLIVRITNEKLKNAKLKRKVIDSISGDMDVRMKAIKPVQVRGVIIKSASDRQRKALTCYPAFLARNYE